MAKTREYEAVATDGSGRIIRFVGPVDATNEQLLKIAESLSSKSAPAKAAPERMVSPEVQGQRDQEQLRILQAEREKLLPKVQAGDASARGDLKALDQEIARLTKAPAVAPAAEQAASAASAAASQPASLLGKYKDAAAQELSNLGTGVAGAGIGLLGGLAESRGRGPASIVEKGAAGAMKGMGITPGAAGAPAVPAAPPVTPPAGPSILGPSGAPMAPAGGAPGRLPVPMGPADAGRMPAGQTGAQTYNWAKSAGLTDIEAGRALDMSKRPGGAADLVNIRREGINLAQKIAPQYRENPMFGGLMTAEPSVGGGPRAQFVPDIPEDPSAPKQQGALRQLPPQQVVPTTPKPPGGLEQVTQMFRKMAETGSKLASGVGGVARALPVLSYPLAGYSMGEDYGAIQQELAKERPDYADIALRGVGALGTGLSLHPATAPVGLPLATMAPLIAAGRRKMQQTPEATPKELEEASRPSFRMSRP